MNLCQKYIFLIKKIIIKRKQDKPVKKKKKTYDVNIVEEKA